ncbi:MAG: aminodeoxychorismate/anthranilate synthase component II [Deltaproteobacteria bacterium]|nr:aminodeoxychorismate/anthranilate synthase component II [Deltaproteobacteria bacterium]
MDVLLLDNRDSFTFNLAQGFAELGASVDVVEADATNAPAVLRARPRLVVIGPGPRGPAELPALLDLVGGLLGEVPIFGVCLGLQALVRAAGGRVARARAPVHGKRDLVQHDGDGVFSGLPSPLWVMRYHSLIAVDVPARFTVSARDRDGQVMALRDQAACVEAVQFHPESIGTAGGMAMLQGALRLGGLERPLPLPRPGAVPGPDAHGPGHPEARYGA